MIVANGEYQCARRVCDCINCVLRTMQVRERECTSAPHTTFVIDMKESPESRVETGICTHKVVFFLHAD